MNPRRVSIRRVMLVVAASAVAMSLTRWASRFDSFEAFAVASLTGSETLFSPRFDEAKFAQIRVGMSAVEVEQLLGPPLVKDIWEDDERIRWVYSRSPSGGNFWRRFIYMQDGHVRHVIGDFYYR